MNHPRDRRGGGVDQPARERIARLRRREDIGRGGAVGGAVTAGAVAAGQRGRFARVDRRARRAGDPGAAGDRLEAASQAAGAGAAIGIEDDVADLSGQPADPAMEPAVEDDAGRDPGPDAEIDEVVGAAELGVAMEADGSGPDVVLDDARDAEARGQAAPEWNWIFPRRKPPWLKRGNLVAVIRLRG